MKGFKVFDHLLLMLISSGKLMICLQSRMATLQGVLGMADRCAGILPGKGILLLACDEKVMANWDIVALSNMGKCVYFKSNTCNAMTDSDLVFIASHT